MRPPQPLLKYDAAWTEPRSGRPSREFYKYVRDLDLVLRSVIALAEAQADMIASLETRIDDLENP